jgi:glutathione synthase
VVNNPTEVRNAPEKLFILNFKELMPPTLITRDPGELDAFRRDHGEIILKPLYGNGGAGIFKTAHDDQNFASLVEMFTTMFKEPFIAQRYLPEVRMGDKRIILVDGKPVGAINRVPALHDHRSNMHVGGTATPTDITKREHEICEIIGPDLKKRGLLFTGIDVIGDYMTEINVTSPTGIRQVKNFGGADIAALIWDAIETKV